MMATLEFVVGPRHVVAWEEGKISVEETPLVQFHAKYWGVSMKKEVDKWRKSAQDEHMEVDSEDDDNNTDGGEANDKQEGIDDYIEGCCILNINIDGMESSIWVRAEYIRIFDHIAELHNRLTSSKRIDTKSCCVILTGQPGIGKSKFFGYAMRRCCAEKRPFIWYEEGFRFLVVQEGVFQAPSTFMSSQYRGFVWTLVDADEDKNGVPEKLVPRHTRHFVIYSTSPAQSRWARVHKTVMKYVMVMNPWTRQEILRAAPLRFDNPNLNYINNTFDEVGPIPRLCIEYTKRELSKYKASLSRALLDLTIDKLQQLVLEARGLDMDAVARKICLVRRLNPTDLDLPFKVEVLPATPSIGSRIAFQLRNAERGKQICLYKQLTSLPSAKKMSGNVFKAYCQQRFSERILIEFVPMVRLGGSKVSGKMSKNKREYLSQWYTKLAPPLLERARKAALKKRIHLDIRPSSSVELISRKLTAEKLKIELDVYYSLVAPNQEGFDSFITHNGILYLFQSTDAMAHDIKDFVDFFNRCTGHPTRKDWRFIFVIPSDTDTAMTCPIPATGALQELVPYSAEVALTI